MKTLHEIGIKYDSDRSRNLIGKKTYYEYYSQVFHFHRIKTILELGIYYGNGLCCFREHFPDAELIGIDASLKTYNRKLQNVSVYESSQTDGKKLKNILSKHSKLDLVIDDASHEVKKSIESFNIIFPFFNTNGIYIIEDLQCFNTKFNKGIIKNVKYDNDVSVSYADEDFDILIDFIKKLTSDSIQDKYEEIRVTNNSLVIIKK